MTHSKAIVTIAIGKTFLETWKKYCEPNWRQYATLHGYDVICIENPLDPSERAKRRSPSWQKCLILSQDFAQRYERVVWIDTDILINTTSAPDITAGIPADKVGAVNMWSHPTPELYRQLLKRFYELWGSSAIINYTAKEYYLNYGLPAGFDAVVQAGVLVLSPQHHREVLERVYFQYEEKGGPEWHMEMRPLSYELLKMSNVHWIDPRFNLMCNEHIIMHYPFLLNPESSLTMTNRLRRRIARLCGAPSTASIRRLCITSIFLNSFFLHLGGSALSDMEAVDLHATSWRHCTL